MPLETRSSLLIVPGLLACLLPLLDPALAPGQVVSSGAGSSVGYIDDAIPQTMFRFRYDSAYDNVRPNRADFFYAPGPPFGPGLPLPERRVDYQDILAYGEYAIDECTSVFVELPVRFLNPEINEDHAGFSDMNAGFQRVLYGDCEQSYLTFQLRTYIPTGNAELGLGTDHVSLEPALLLYQQLDERLTLEAEVRYWIPIDGTSFAGDVVRYGVGFSYAALETESLRIRPVVEFVGWTVLDGKATAVSPFGVATIEDAAGDTIVNAKLGVRTEISCDSDFYLGYGVALTGDQWYRDIVRLEYRIRF